MMCVGGGDRWGGGVRRKCFSFQTPCAVAVKYDYYLDLMCARARVCVYACVCGCEFFWCVCACVRERVSGWVAVGFMLLSRNCMCASFFLQGFVKIARWSEMNYWALKESTEKTHRTVHKHARAFQVGGSRTNFSFVWREQSPHFFTPQLCSLLHSWKKSSTAFVSMICK